MAFNMPSIMKKRPNKLVLGFAAVAATAIIGTTGLAAAATPTGNGYGNTGIGGNLNLNLNLKNSSHNVITIIVNIFH